MSTYSIPLRPTRQAYLYIGLALSLMLHCLALALRFTAPPASPPITSTLEVVLLNAYDVSTPVKPAALAQVSMDGGGQAAEGIARSPLPPSQDAFQLPRTAPASEHVELGEQERELIAQNDGAISLTERKDTAETTDVIADAMDTAATLAMLTQEYAAVSRRVENYNRQPRRHYFAPSTSASRYAEYVEAWREHVERVGNELYDATVPAGMYGSLRLTVFVRADGTVEGLAFDTRSVHPELNAAAQVIVQQAAPFAAFPENIRRETDVIAITRTWHFENDTITTELP